MLKLRKINKNNLDLNIYHLFESNRFYFGSKRPETLTEGQINKILRRFDNVYVIEYQNTAIGLIGTEGYLTDDSLCLSIRSNDMRFLISHIKILSDWLIEVKGDYQILRAHVYDFDFEGKALYDKLFFQKEAVFKEHVYKFNQYHDVIVYVKKY